MAWLQISILLFILSFVFVWQEKETLESKYIGQMTLFRNSFISGFLVRVDNPASNFVS
jgi:hypothetical protein